MFFGFVTKHACDRRTDRHTDRITIPKTALAYLLRAVKTKFKGGFLDRGLKLGLVGFRLRDAIARKRCEIELR